MSQLDIQPESILKKSSLKPVFLSLLILLSGVIIGAGATLLLTNEDKTKPVPPGPEYMSKRTVDRIVRELNLSEEQRKKLDPIVEKHMKEIDEIRNQARPHISEQLKEMNEEIFSILDEHQKVLWEESVRRMQELFARMRDRRGPRDERREPGQRRPEWDSDDPPRFPPPPERTPIAPDQGPRPENPL